MIKMSKALVNNKTKDITDAKSGEIGECLICKKPVIAKCGQINEIHWAHVGSESPYDIESHNEWHISWKNFFEKVGYSTERKFGNFIADAYDPKTNTVIEYQHSPITPQEIIDRCKHHKGEGRNIIWILDYTGKYKDSHIEIRLKNKGNYIYYTFTVKWQIKDYIFGLFNEEIEHLNVQTYFNIIFNKDINEYVPLEIVNCTDIDIESTRIENVLLYVGTKKFLEVNYDKNKAVLLKVKTVHKKGKNGSCEIIFI